MTLQGPDAGLALLGQADEPTRPAAVVRKGGLGGWGKVPMAPVDTARISDAGLEALLAGVRKTP